MSNADTGDVEQQGVRIEQQDQRLLAQREAEPAGKPRRNGDALAAVIASLIGLLALMVSGYTAYVQREQLHAQVLPHLTIKSSNVDPETSWHVTNEGMGPARVTAMRVIVDGEPATGWDDVKKTAGYRDGGNLITSWISHAIVSAGKQVAFVRPYPGERSQVKFQELLPGRKHELYVTLCYCSFLGDCWIASSSDILLDGMRTTLDDCPIKTAERFLE